MEDLLYRFKDVRMGDLKMITLYNLNITEKIEIIMYLVDEGVLTYNEANNILLESVITKGVNNE